MSKVRLKWEPLAVPGVDGPLIESSETPREVECLQELARGGVVAEIGTAFGYGAIVMALVAERVVSADPHRIWLGRGQDSLAISQANAEAYGVRDRIEFRVGRAADVLTEEGGYDGCFVDGDHSPRGAAADCELAEALVKPGGWIAFHDYDTANWPGVKEAVDAHWPDEPERVVDTLYIRRA